MSQFFSAWIWPALLKQSILIVSAVLIPVVLIVGQLALPWFTRDLLNAIQNEANLIPPTCWLLIGWSGAKILVRAQVFWTAGASVYFIQTLRELGLRDVFNLSYSDRAKRSQSSWTQLILDLAKSIECIYGLMVWNILPTVGLFIVILIEVFHINYLFFWTYLLYVTLQMALIYSCKEYLYHECQRQSMFKNQLIDDLQQLLANPSVTAPKVNQQLCIHFTRLSQPELRSRKQLILRFNFTRALMDFLAIGVFTLSILIIIYQHQHLVWGDLSFILMTLMSTIERAWTLGQNWCELQRSISLLANHRWLLNPKALPKYEHINRTKASYNLVIRQLNFAFEHKTIFNGFNLCIPDTFFCGLHAIQGQGKSTLLKLISGELTPQQGHIILNQHPIHDLSLKERQGLFMRISETNLFFSHLTVNENLRLYHKSTHSTLSVHEALFQTGCHRWPHTYLNTQASQLSRGQQQQLNIALALLHTAPIWLIDEALSHLDDCTHQWVIQHLKTNRSIKKIIMVSHHQRDQAYFEHQIFMLNPAVSSQ